MNKKFGIIAVACMAIAILSGCHSGAPADTSAGLNGIQQRALTIRNIGYESDATYDDVWLSTISTLQLNGFILKDADKKSGYIYGVWQNSYENQEEVSRGGFTMVQASSSPSYFFGAFFARTQVYKQVDVSVTLEPLAKTQTLVRLVARFDNTGVPVAEGVFANRFFGLLRKEIFIRKNGGSIYNGFSVSTTK